MIQSQSGTILTNRIAVKGFVKRDLRICFLAEKLAEYAKAECRKIREKLFQNAGVAFDFQNGTSGYFVPKLEIAFKNCGIYPDKMESFLNLQRTHTLTQVEIRYLFIENQDFFRHVKGVSSELDDHGFLGFGKGTCFIGCDDGKLDIRNDMYKDDKKNARWIPCCSVTKEEFHRWIENGYTDDTKNPFSLICNNDGNDEIIKKHNEIIKFIENNQFYLEMTNFSDEITPEELLKKYKKFIQGIFKLCNLKQEEILELNKEFEEYISREPKLNEKETAIVIRDVLYADHFRTNIPPSTQPEIQKNGTGIWELYECSDDYPIALLSEQYASKNPEYSCQRDGIVGIDFGTKSTVVSKLNNANKTELIRIGSLEYHVETQKKDYENPTVLEFRDIRAFLIAYHDKFIKGRPYTTWDMIQNSYTANHHRENAESNELDRFLNDLKQWCGDTSGTRILNIRDERGVAITLPLFKDCEDFVPQTLPDCGYFDPLEIYAYYLGLIINRGNEIYLNYVMSFPITYNIEVRNKMCSSFKRGLQRSLPDAIVRNKELMQEFRVEPKWSEPAAYAICALNEYPFKPTENHPEFYSVFDFGGGTTDMIFGIWRLADKNNRDEQTYDSIIEQFNEEGDNHLGGENLLELLAFEIFKANAVLLNQEKIYCFTKPAECNKFPGSERLIQNDARSARRNTMQLTKLLRPFWEGLKSYSPPQLTGDETEAEKILKGYRLKPSAVEKTQFLESGYIEMDLEDENGVTDEKVKVYINSEENGIFVDMIDILEKRIERGIISYFHALKTALSNEKAKDVHIVRLLLAGNSCKSPIVDKLFSKYIHNLPKELQEIQIELYHPLGMKQYASEVNPDAESQTDNADRPTGKTGVAYGLIKSSIAVYEETSIKDEAKFKFYLGHIRERNFKVVIKRDMPYKQWFYFGYPANRDFDLFYTHLPDALSGTLSEKFVNRSTCRIKQPDRDKDVYIRLISPDTIEYGIGEICNKEAGSLAENIEIESLGEIHLKP